MAEDVTRRDQGRPGHGGRVGAASVTTPRFREAMVAGSDALIENRRLRGGKGTGHRHRGPARTHRSKVFLTGLAGRAVLGACVAETG
jgi:hypothetical protein